MRDNMEDIYSIMNIKDTFARDVYEVQRRMLRSALFVDKRDAKSIDHRAVEDIVKLDAFERHQALQCSKTQVLELLSRYTSDVQCSGCMRLLRSLINSSLNHRSGFAEIFKKNSILEQNSVGKIKRDVLEQILGSFVVEINQMYFINGVYWVSPDLSTRQTTLDKLNAKPLELPDLKTFAKQMKLKTKYTDEYLRANGIDEKEFTNYCTFLLADAKNSEGLESFLAENVESIPQTAEYLLKAGFTMDSLELIKDNFLPKAGEILSRKELAVPGNRELLEKLRENFEKFSEVLDAFSLNNEIYFNKQFSKILKILEPGNEKIENGQLDILGRVFKLFNDQAFFSNRAKMAKAKVKRRCALHVSQPKLDVNWGNIWFDLRKTTQYALCKISVDDLINALNDYLKAMSFCRGCRCNVRRAMEMLIDKSIRPIPSEDAASVELNKKNSLLKEVDCSCNKCGKIDTKKHLKMGCSSFWKLKEEAQRKNQCMNDIFNEFDYSAFSGFTFEFQYGDEDDDEDDVLDSTNDRLNRSGLHTPSGETTRLNHQKQALSSPGPFESQNNRALSETEKKFRQSQWDKIKKITDKIFLSSAKGDRVSNNSISSDMLPEKFNFESFKEVFYSKVKGDPRFSNLPSDMLNTYIRSAASTCFKDYVRYTLNQAEDDVEMKKFLDEFEQKMVASDLIEPSVEQDAEAKGHKCTCSCHSIVGEQHRVPSDGDGEFCDQCVELSSYSDGDSYLSDRPPTHILCGMDDVPQLIQRALENEQKMEANRGKSKGNDRHAPTLKEGQQEVLMCVGNILLIRLKDAYAEYLMKRQTEEMLLWLILTCMKTNVQKIVQKRYFSAGEEELIRFFEEGTEKAKKKKKKAKKKKPKAVAKSVDLERDNLNRLDEVTKEESSEKEKEWNAVKEQELLAQMGYESGRENEMDEGEDEPEISAEEIAKAKAMLMERKKSRAELRADLKKNFLAFCEHN